jgi:hypothetical protein
MNQSPPILQHADAVRSQAFTGNLQRTSLLPGELAMRPPVSPVERPWWHWPAITTVTLVAVYELILALAPTYR